MIASDDALLSGVAGEEGDQQPQRGPGGRTMTLKNFDDQRRAWLLAYPDIQTLATGTSTSAPQKATR